MILNLADLKRMYGTMLTLPNDQLFLIDELVWNGQEYICRGWYIHLGWVFKNAILKVIPGNRYPHPAVVSFRKDWKYWEVNVDEFTELVTEGMSGPNPFENVKKQSNH